MSELHALLPCPTRFTTLAASAFTSPSIGGRMKLFARTVLVVFALGALGAPVAAQQITAADDGPARKGFYIGLGLAGASFKADCDGCDEGVDPATGFGTHIKLGGTLSPKFRLGTDIFGVQTSDGIFDALSGLGPTSQEGAGHAMLALTFYPSASGNLWLQGGIGGVAYYADVKNDQRYIARGGGAMLGLGYDLRVGQNGSITPYLSWTASSGGKLYDANVDEVTPAGDWSTAFIAFGVDYIFH